VPCLAHVEVQRAYRARLKAAMNQFAILYAVRFTREA
jgi:hypothetical protein